MPAARWVDEQWANFVFSTYGISVDAAVSMRTVTGIVSGNRRYVLKPFRDDRFDRPRVEVVGRMLERLDASGVRVAQVMRTKKGQFVARARNMWVSLQTWAPGRHTDLRNTTERHALVTEVGRLHASATVVDKGEQSLLRVTPLDVKYAKRARYFRERIQRFNFNDPVLEKKINDYAYQAENVAAWLRQSVSLRIASRRDSQCGILCHRDLAPHNALYQNGCATLIDFDLAGMDVRGHDLYQLINHTIYLLGWDERVVEDVIAVYESVYPLCPDNIDLVYHLLSFPMLLVREMTGEHLEHHSAGRNPRLRWALQVEDQRARWLRHNW